MQSQSIGFHSIRFQGPALGAVRKNPREAFLRTQKMGFGTISEQAPVKLFDHLARSLLLGGFFRDRVFLEIFLDLRLHSGLLLQCAFLLFLLVFLLVFFAIISRNTNIAG